MLRPKWILLILGIIGLVVCSLILAKPTYHKFKNHRASQLANEALEIYLADPYEPSVVQEAALKAQSALQLTAANYEVNRTMASISMFTSPPTSLKYWEQAMDMWKRETSVPVADQMQFVQSLILNGQFERAREQLEAIKDDNEATADAVYNLVKVCFLLGDKDAALDYGREMVRHPKTPVSRYLFFADMCLVSDDEKVNREGRRQIEFLLENESLLDDSLLWDITQLDGLGEALSRKVEGVLNTRVTDFDERISLVEYRLKNEILSKDQALGQLMESLDRADDLAVIRMAQWCDDKGFAEHVVELMNVDLATKRKDWFLMYLKNLGKVEQWQVILRILNTEDCPIEDFLTKILRSEAYSASGNELKSVNAWYRAKLAADPTVIHYWLLVRVGDRMGLEQETEKLLRELVILGVDPEEILSYIANREFATEDYDEFYRILTGFVELYTNNDAIRADWVYYSFLMERNFDQAMESINRLVEKEPSKLQYHMTWSLGKVRKGQYREVLGRLQKFDLDWLDMHPKWRFILALALAGVGEYEQGEVYLEGVEFEDLNPYEKGLYEKLYNYRLSSRQ